VNQPSLYHRTTNQLSACAAATGFALTIGLAMGLMSLGNPAIAFDELNEAQTLLFDSPHLMNTREGQSISYNYRSKVDEEQPVEDVVTINVTAQVDEERRDVEINFLTDERHLVLPPFPGYRGNPVLMAMLERIAREIGEDTGGGVLYFRNRIRDGLAGDNVRIEKRTMSVNDNDVDATVLQFQPFENDQRIEPDSIFSEATFTITLSNTVPGSIVEVGINTPSQGPSAFSRQLTIAN